VIVRPLPGQPVLWHDQRPAPGRQVLALRALGQELRGRKGRAFEDVESRARLADRPGGVHGQDRRHRLCIGGGFALLLAPRHGFSASSVNYGVGASKETYSEASLEGRRLGLP
jgi:hypothetical protein